MTFGDSGYIRGGAGVTINLRRVLQLVLALSVAGLAVAVVVTAISAGNQNARNAALRQHGVPVVVTVTGCTGYGSGIAQAVNYYRCQGDFTLGNEHYTGVVIGGLRSRVPPGDRVGALAVPGDAASLRTAASVRHPGSTFAPYITPLVLGVLTLVLAAALAWSVRRRRG